MSKLQLESVSDPFTTKPLIRKALDLLTKAEAMGLLEGVPVIHHLDAESFERVLRQLAERGIGREAYVRLQTNPDAKDYEESLEDLIAALEDSAVPETEWGALQDVFPDEDLAKLVGVAGSSVRRYRTGERDTPDDVAARLHFIAGVVGDLAGSYNARGVRRWFTRARPQLEERSPVTLLAGDWDPADEEAIRVRDLARSLPGAGAT
jgi:uncharacterized protein (DUF2384 family)